MPENNNAARRQRKAKLRMPPATNSLQQRRLGLAALAIGYVCHFAASLVLPEWRYLSIIFWFIALGGGALYCAETLKCLRA